MSEQAKIDAMSILLTLQHELRSLRSYRDFGFFVVNETYRLLRYQSAVLWHHQPGLGYRLSAVSGVATIDAHSPFNVWLVKVIHYCKKEFENNGVKMLSQADFPDDITNDWPNEVGQQLLWCPFNQEGHDSNEGMIFLRENEWSEGEVKRLHWLLQSYAYSWYFLSHKRGVMLWCKNIWRYKRKLLLFCSLGVTAILLFPIHQSIIAPAEVVAKDPALITAPMGGVIRKIEVASNSSVKKGQVLFEMDNTELLNNTRLAQQQYQVALEEYQRAIQKGFKNRDSRAKINGLRAAVNESTDFNTLKARLLAVLQ